MLFLNSSRRSRNFGHCAALGGQAEHLCGEFSENVFVLHENSFALGALAKIGIDILERLPQNLVVDIV